MSDFERLDPDRVKLSSVNTRAVGMIERSVSREGCWEKAAGPKKDSMPRETLAVITEI